MSEAKHTPGPWITGTDEDSDLFLVGPASFDDVVTHPVVSLHSEANARLIAAAPELLEALTYAIKQVPELGSVPGIAGAIAKASGGAK